MTPPNAEFRIVPIEHPIFGPDGFPWFESQRRVRFLCFSWWRRIAIDNSWERCMNHIDDILSPVSKSETLHFDKNGLGI